LACDPETEEGLPDSFLEEQNYQSLSSVEMKIRFFKGTQQH